MAWASAWLKIRNQLGLNAEKDCCLLRDPLKRGTFSEARIQPGAVLIPLSITADPKAWEPQYPKSITEKLERPLNWPGHVTWRPICAQLDQAGPSQTRLGLQNAGVCKKAVLGSEI